MMNPLTNLSMALGRRTTPPLPRAPAATRAALLSARSAFSSQVGGVLPVKHPNATNAPVITRFIKSPKGTIFVFGGVLGGLVGLPKAKFVSMMQSAKKDIVIFKDFHQDWFQSGLAGVASSRDETEAFIHTHFGNCARPWTFLGSGTGGFSALYFGLAFEANRIRAFSPQTVIDADAVKTFIQDTPENWGINLSDPQNDLLNHPELGTPRSNVAIYYAKLSKRDVAHVDRLRGTSNTDFVPVQTHLNDCAIALRRNSELRNKFK